MGNLLRNETHSISRTGPFGGSCQIHGSTPMPQSESDDLSNIPDIDNGSSGIKSPIINNPAFSHSNCPPEIHRSCFCVRFIAEHTKLLEDSTKASTIHRNVRRSFTVSAREGHTRKKKTRIRSVFEILNQFTETLSIFTHRIAGERGLEVRCNGIGPSVFMDFHIGRCGWYSWHHIAGADTLR